MRLAHTQVCPAFLNFDAITCWTAAGMSASSQDDERRVTAKLERHALHRARRLLVQLDAHLGAAGEGELADARVGEKHVRHRHGIGGRQHLEDVGGSAGLHPQLAETNRRQRRLLRGLQHHRASGRQRGRDLARHHRRGKIPGRHRIHGTHRLAHRKQPLVRGMARHDVAIRALGFFGIPLHEAGGVFHLAPRFGDRLAHLLRHQSRERVFILQDQLEPPAQNR